jgi:cytochrome o ubiquinol oxidase subunit 1
MPKNSAIGLLVGGCAFLVGFGLTWHIMWLTLVGLVGVFAFLIIRLSDDDTDYYVRKEDVAKIEIEVATPTLVRKARI